MPVKSSYANFVKSLRTKYPNNINKRHPLSPNQQLTQHEFTLMLPAALKDSVRVKGATSQIGK